MNPGERTKTRCTFLTPHDLRRLDWACRPIAAQFDDLPYLVGSAMEHDRYRDIDIRLILPDEEFDRFTGGKRDRHMLLNVAFTALIESMCRMPAPIDFQFQSASEAATFDGPRNPLGMR